QWLSLPVLHKGRYHQSIASTELNPRVDWRRKHWKALEWNYGKTPYWERYSGSLAQVYQRDWTLISPFTSELIRWFMDQLELDADVRIASELAAAGNSTEYIVSFCRELGATTYISGVHGRDYLELDQFANAGIDLQFQKYTPPTYTGFNNEPAEPNLSMLDMMFWRGDEAKEWVHSATELTA
ncbi:MAG: WbqC family protein, partial [Planctomycetota bacterium]